MESPSGICFTLVSISDSYLHVRFQFAGLTKLTAPLFNAEGKVAFFLGGQINCSTTIHNRSDILRALSLSDDAVDPAIEFSSGASINQIEKKRGFFRSLRIRSSSNKASDDREAGIEGELMQKIEKVDFKQQMKMFYTAYSKVCMTLC